MARQKPDPFMVLAQLPVTDVLGTVERSSLSGQVYRQVRKALMIGALKPGQKLSGRELAGRLGTSLTPVREALLQLVAEGVLESRAGHSITVPTLTRADYLELRDIRVEVEGLAAARAATNRDPACIARLEGLHDSLVMAKAECRFDDALRWNEAFHLELARCSGMPRLLRVVESLWAQSGPFLNFLYSNGDVGVPDGGSHGHVKLIEALKVCDAAAATQAIARDIIGGGDNLVRSLGD